jgi:hypothetical protein
MFSLFRPFLQEMTRGSYGSRHDERRGCCVFSDPQSHETNSQSEALAAIFVRSSSVTGTRQPMQQFWTILNSIYARARRRPCVTMFGFSRQGR